MADKPVKQTFWTFQFKEGPAPRQGLIEASNKDRAYMVAQRLCQIKGWIGPMGEIREHILATEDILKTPVSVAEELPVVLDPVGATTAVNG